MWQKVRDFIEEQQLLRHEDLHLVALSGGADSVALALVLLRLGYRIEAAHCNFHLRGAESERDEQFVQQFCRDHGIPLHLIHFDTRAYATLHHVSIEMAARDLRYGYFRQLLSDIGAATVCVAHHRDDAVETLLMNLLRGAGIHGLTGIRPRRDFIVRPLLAVTRREIEQYLESEGQSYVTDSTNLCPDVLRNRIRLEVLPLLQDLNPSASEKLFSASVYLAEAESVYASSVEGQIRLVCHPDELPKSLDEASSARLSIDISALLSQPSPEALLHEILSRFGFPSQVTSQVLTCVRQQQSGREFFSATHQLVVDRQELFVEPLQQPMKPFVIPEGGFYRLPDESSIRLTIEPFTEISRSPLCVTFDALKVRFPLTLRPWREGDRFQPFGMRGTRLVSDFLTDQKLMLFEKRRQLLLVDASDSILWVVGLRPAHPYCVTPATSKVLRIEFSHSS